MDAWERIYAKFFFVIVFVVIGLVAYVFIRSDPKLLLKVVAIFASWLAMMRFLPARLKRAIDGWAFKNRVNGFMYVLLQLSLLFGAVHMLVGGKIHWMEYLINVGVFALVLVFAGRGDRAEKLDTNKQQ